ncbi:uncharacterized protein LOC114299424 [Camellia sinensis]|uniref:uncharacterized protein LOC114299424 n=1 Tax=Camellia sinensis TaxID=4442 RepID=UPI0010357472|nr:uncharacterized protein LOC114299424 [Camellia sinensis]
MLRYKHRDCHELLSYMSSYRYSAKQKGKVTDFFRAPAPPPDPTLPHVPLIRLTEEKEMAKRSRIKNLFTATSAELPSNLHLVPTASQSSGTVIALASIVAPLNVESCRAGKRPHTADPSAKLVAELHTEQVAEVEPIPTWESKLKHREKDIPVTTSIIEDKEKLLAFDLTKSLLLPGDMVGQDHVPDTRMVKSAVKSITRTM